MAIATQVEAVNAACAFLRGALGDMQLKRPRRMADGSLDDEHVDWAPVEVYAQYIPLETAAESARPELTGLTRCPSATVMLRGMALESAGGMGAEQVSYDLRVALLTYDPGVRPIDGHIELPDAQGWVSALALSDRVVLALRAAGAIDGCLVTGIKAQAWEQNGVAVDARPMYRTLVDFRLETLALPPADHWGTCDLD